MIYFFLKKMLLITPLGEVFKKYSILKFIVSFNKIIVRFTKQSIAIIKLTNKLILKGFKIISRY